MASPSLMTPPNKVLLVLVLALLAGVLYQAQLLAGQKREQKILAGKNAAWQKQTREWQWERDHANALLVSLEEEIRAMEAESEPAASAANDASLTAWLRRVDRLHDWLRQNPARQIPEMRFLNSNDWLAVTFDNRLETDAQIRTALKKLRAMAKAKPELGANISQALQAYAREHDGKPVDDPSQLRPYLRPALGDDILARYATVLEIPGENDREGVNREGTHFKGAGRVILEEHAIADEDYDTQLLFMEQGLASVTVSQLGRTVDLATAAFRQANPGQLPATAEQLLPYFTTPVDAASLREYWDVRDK